MRYSVRTLPRAEFDAQQIYDWIHERAPEGALRWWQAFEDACKSLKRNPLAYGFAAEAESTGREIRQFLFKTSQGNYYRALFIVVDDEVRVLRVRGPGQPELLPDELL
jgi:plasmid stabilization system protein ParE